MMHSKPASRNSAEHVGTSIKNDGRLRLLGSASALAGAIGFVGMVSSPAAAQSIPQHIPQPPRVEITLPTQAGGPVSGPIMRGAVNDIAPISSTSGPSFQQPIAPQHFVERGGLTLNPPTVPAPQNIIIVPAQAEPIIAQTPDSGPVRTFSSTPAPSPGDTDTNGINVRASANYTGTEIDFRPGAAGDVVDVFASESIINWTTFDAGTGTNEVLFLGAGGSLEFTSALSDYTVLNRVFTPGIDSAIRIDGAVTSNVLGGAATGGNIWFYSPGGMIIGSTGSFNVGSLVLTSSDLNSIDFGGQQLNFSGVAEPDTAVVIEAGATIDASNYVAVVAPRVVQGGTVTVDGSVAYVGAEEAQLTINNGLFDITLGVGTEDANGVVHTGTTTGAASQAVVDGMDDIVDADARAIYMVSLAKNDAINMLVGGDIGYQPAASAARTSNGSIILSAGADVLTGGDITAPTITLGANDSSEGGSIEFTGGSFTSDVTAGASANITIFPEFGQTISIGSDGLGAYGLNLSAGESINFGAGIGGTLSIDGDVTLRAGLDQASGGTINLQSIGNTPGPFDPIFGNGVVDIGGNLTLDASASGRDDFDAIRNNGGTGIGEDAAAGNITVNISNNATLNVDGNFILDASAQGGKGAVQNGSSTGGNIAFTVSGGSVDVTGTLELNTSALDAAAFKLAGSGSGSLGSDSVAGDINLTLSGGGLDVETISLIANAEGSSGSDLSVEQDNSAAAGNVTLDVTGGFHFVDNVQINARATGGGSADAAGNSVTGSAERGTATIAVSNPSTLLVVAQNVNIDVETSGPVAAPTGNVVSILIDGTFEGGLRTTGDININTSAGNGSEIDTTEAGSVLLQNNNGTLTFDRLSVDANATPDGPFSFGGGSGSGQNFQAGDITIASITGGNISGGSAFLNADASGADGTGGSGTGGNILFDANDGAINFSSTVRTSVDGTGGVGEDLNNPGGVATGTGGQVRFLLRGTNGAMNFRDLSASADGQIAFDVETGTSSFVGDGGSGTAGGVIFDIEDGDFTARSLNISADGFGGQGGDISTDPTAVGAGPVGRGGSGTGGTVVFNLTGGEATVSNLTVTADGFGGDGAFGDIDSDNQAGDGGTATGGTATFNAASGSLDVTNNLTVSAASSGGDGGNASGVNGATGGAAVSGDAIFNMDGTASVSAGSVTISADATGGDGGGSDSYFDPNSGFFESGEAGGDGASGTAGNAVFNNISGDISFGSLTVSANGTGGDGGNSESLSGGIDADQGGQGAAGIGGTATINLNQDDATNPTYIARATGLGGDGASGADGGAGGSATGGIARINVNDVEVNLSSATIDASATGGTGAFAGGESGDGGDGGDAVGGSAILDINGANAVFTSTNAVTMRAGATGGNGAEGGSAFFNPVAPGNGGAGGSAQGGLVQIISRDGATADYLSDGSTDAGSIAGNGGDAGVSGFDDAINGDGGDAGTSVGGSIEASALNGGSLTLSAVSTDIGFGASSVGGSGGNGGAESEGLINIYGQNSETTGGTITLSADGAGSSLTLNADLVATARAVGARDGRLDAVGADGTGGDLTLTATNGATLSATRSVRLDGSATAADGRFTAGTATGGTVNVITDSGSTMSLQSLDVNVQANGGVGGVGEAAGGRDGGDAIGGNANIVADSTSTFSATALLVNANGSGGVGGNANFAQVSGDGGSGAGGSISIDFSGDFIPPDTSTIQAIGSGGTGGSASLGATAGAGGNAQGGTISLGFTGDGALPSLSTALNTSAIGGNGGTGADTFTIGGFAATDGGAGGNAVGGNSSFSISGDGASLTIDGNFASIISDATGGTGGTGGSDSDGTAGGAGGAGGDSTGGTVAVIANSGTSISLSGGSGPFVLSSNGTGGTGGFGGSSTGAGGTGGQGGTGTGGAPVLRAIGGTISGGDVNLSATGTGGTGGRGGVGNSPGGSGTGNGGDGFGGTPLIEALEGSPGVITLGAVTIDASGAAGGGTISGTTGGGQITITDASADPAGLITMSSLTVTAAGAPLAGTPSLTFESGSGPITVTGNVNADVAGDILFDFDANGQLVVGGAAQLNAGGDITVIHTNNTASTLSLDIANALFAIAAGNFDSQAGSIVSADELLIDVEGDIDADDLRAVPGMNLLAGGSVALNNASATGPQGISNLNGIFVQAGESFFGSISEYDPNSNVTITGSVQSYSNIAIEAGGTATFVAGANVAADNLLSVVTGDDIIIASGASLSSANNPIDAINTTAPFAGGPNMQLLAGNITDLLTTANTPIGSLVIDGTINANDGAAILSGNAVDALDASITASSLRADIRNAPGNGVILSDDNGLLSAACLQGTVCLGSITADNRIEIGQNSGNDVIQLVVAPGTINAQDILITTRADINMGSAGIASTLTASNQFSATSTQGNVNLLDAVITSDSIIIDAAGSLLGTASLISTNDVGIDVGQDINALLIDAGGQLTTVAGVGGGLNATYTVAGDINVGTYNQDANFRVQVLAGGDIGFGAVNINGNADILLTAGTAGAGDVFLGTATGARDIDLRGDNISFTDLSASQFIDFQTVGSITGGSLSSGSLMTLDGGSINVGDLAPGFILDIDARSGDIQTGDITTTSSVDLEATGNVTTGDVTANAGATLRAGGNIDTGTVTTTSAVGFIRLLATGSVDFDGIVNNSLIDIDGTAISGGDILAGANLNIDGTSIDIGNARSTGGFVLINSTAGDVTATTLTSDQFGVTISSAANNALGDINAAGTINVSSVGNTVVGDAIAGGSLVLNVDGDLTAGLLDAQTFSPGMTITVDGDADIEGTTTNGLLTINVVGALTGGDITGRSLARITAGSINVDSAQSTTQALVVNATNGDAVISSTNSSAGTTVTATGDADVGDATSGTFTTIRADNVSLDSGNIGSTLTLDATAGDLTGTGAITVGGSINLDATGNIDTGSLSAQAGNFTADAGGTIGFVSAAASGTLAFEGLGGIAGGSLASGGAMTLDGPSVVVGDINTGGAGDVTITSTTGIIQTGDVTARILTADAATDLTLGVVDAVGRDIRGIAINLDAGGTIGFTSLLSGRGIDIDGTAINAGNITSDNGVNILADSIVVGDVLVTEIGDVTLESTNGDLTAGNLTSNTFGVFVTSSDAMTVGDLTVVGNSNSSDIAIVAGGDTSLGDVAAGDRLTIDVTGNLTTGALTSDNVSPGMRIDVTGDAAIASASDPSGAIALTIGGALTGGAFMTNGVLNFDADSIDIDSATATGGLGSVNVTTATGDVAIDTISAGNDVNTDIGGNFTFITATADDNIDLVAGGSVLGGDLTAVGDLDIDANNIAIGDAEASTISLISGTDIRFDNLNAPNTISLTATNGTIAANTGSGDITSDDDVDLLAQVINVGNITSGGGVFADATVGNADFAIVDADDDIIITAAGTPNLTNAISGGDTTITGASITFNNGTIGNDLTLNATAGDIDGNGAVTVGGDIDFDATGDIGFGDLEAQGGSFTVDAGGDIAFTGATSSVDVVLTAVGAINGGDVDATGTARLNGGNVVLGDVSAANIDLTSALDIQFDSLSSPNAISVTALGGTIGASAAGTGDIDSDSDVDLTSAVIAVGDITTGGSLTASATAGDASFGAVDAVDAVTISATGTPTVQSITSGGNADLTGASVSLSGGDIGGALTLTATAGDVTLALDGTDQILVGGQARLDASGDIIATHTNNTADTISLDATGNILATALGSINAQAGSILSGNEVFLLASGNVDAADIRAVPGIVIGAGGSVTLADATVAGPQGVSNIRGLVIDAGLDPLGGSGFYDNGSNATITGTVNSYADVTVRAGGNAVFAAGSATTADDRVFVQTGDDIIIEAGANITSANNPSIAPNTATPFDGVGAIELDAGGLPNILSIPFTPLASLVVDGTLNANTGAIIATANAIDGLDGTFTGSSIALDVRDAPPAGFTQGDDNGLLSANCLGGNVCVGDIIADNVIEIGQNSNNDVIQLFIEQGTVNANEIRISTREDIVMGTAGIATTLNAANVFSATSLTGDVNLLDAAISSDQIQISAAGSLIGTASLTSTNDIGITVGDSITLASLNAGGQLTQAADVGGALEATYSVPGTIDIGSLTIGSGDVDYDAGGDILLGSVDVGANDVALTAAGLASISAGITAQNLSIDANAIQITNVTLPGDIDLVSNTAVDLGTLDADAITIDSLDAVNVSGSLTAQTDITIDTVGMLTGGDFDAAGTLQVTAGNIAIGNGTAGTLDLGSDSDIVFDSLSSTNAITLEAAGGTIAANTGLGEISSDGDVTLTAQTIDLTDITSGGTITATTTLGNAGFGVIDAVNDIIISAALDATVVNAISGRDTSISGESVVLGFGTVGRDFILTATDGDVDATSFGLFVAGGGLGGAPGDGSTAALAYVGGLGAGGPIVALGDNITVGGAITLDASNNVTFENLDAQGGNFDVTAGQDVLFQSATSAGSVAIDAGALIASRGLLPADIAAANNVDLTGADIDIATINAGGAVSATALGGNIQLVRIDAVDTINLDASGFIFVDHAETDADFIASAIGNFGTGPNTIITGGNIIINADIVDLVNSMAGGLIDVTGSQIDFTSITAGSTIDLETIAITSSNGSGNITGTDMTAGLGGSSLVSLGSISVTGASQIGGSLSMDSGTDMLFGTIVTQAGGISADANGTITYGSMNSGADINLFAAGLISGGDLDAVAALTLDGADIAIGDGSADTIDITTGADILFDSLTAPTAITLLAATGAIGANTGNGDIDSGGNVDLTAQTIAIGNSIAGGTFTANATAGSGTFGAIDSAGSTDIATAGAMTASAISTSNTGAGISLNASGAAGDVTTGALTTNDGDILVSAGNDISLSTATTSTGTPLGGSIGLLAAGNITASGRLSAGEDVAIRSLADISLAAVEAGDDVALQADGALSLDTATTTGTGIDLFALTFNEAAAGQAGSILFAAENPALAGSNIQLTGAADVTATGVLDAADDITVNAAGTPSLINTISGGDTTITGTSVTLNNGTVGGDLTLDATAGDIDGNGTITVGGAIDFDATGDVGFGTLDAQGGTFTVDAGGAITFIGATSTDFITMNANGAINGGDLTAANGLTLDGATIAIGDASAGTMTLTSAADILFNSLTSPNAISVSAINGAIGANTGAGDIDSGGDVDLFAQTVAVGDVISGGSIVADASAGDATFGAVDAVNDITISATGTPTLTSATSGGSASIIGSSVTLNSGTIGGSLDLNATAGDIDATGAITVGGTITMDAAGDVAFGDLAAGGGDFDVDAGGDISYGTASAAINLDFQAGGAIIGGDLSALNALTLDGANIIIGDVSAPLIGIDSDADILFDSLNGPTQIILNADNGTIGANTGNGDIDSNADIDLSALIIAVGDVTSGGSVTGNAATGDASFGTVDAANTITISAAGAATVANAISGGDTSVTGASVALGDGTIGGDLTLNAAAGNIFRQGTVDVAGSIDLDATGFIGIGRLTARGGSLTADAGGEISFTEATANTDVVFVAGGQIIGADVTAGGSADLSGNSIFLGSVTAADIVLNGDIGIGFETLDATGTTTLTASNGPIAAIRGFGNIDSDGDVSLTAQSIDLGDVTSGGSIGADATDGDAAFGTVDAATDITITATGTPTLVNAISGGDTRITGASVGLNAANVGGDLSLNAVAGDVDGNGAITVGGGIDIDAAGAVSFGDLAAQGGNFTVDAGGEIAFGSATSSGDIVFGTAGSVIGGDLTAATGMVAIDAGDIAIGDVAAASVDLTSNSDILFDSLTSADVISLSALNGVISANTGPGDIDSDGDVDLTAQTLAVGDITSGGSFTGTATDGDAAFGTITAAGNVSVDASGTPSFAGVTSGGDTSITGAAIAFSNGDIGGALSLTSTVGDLSGTGTTTAGGDVDLSSAGAISFADINAPAGRFFATAEGDIMVGAVSTATGIFIDSLNGGDITANSLTSDQDITITTDGAVIAQGVLGSATGSLITVDADDGITIGTLTGRDARLDSGAGSVTVDTDIDVAEVVDAEGISVSLRSLGDLRTISEASNGNIDINVAGDLDLQGAIANGDITVFSGGSTTVNGTAVLTTTPTQPAVSQGTQQAISNTGNISFTAGGDLVVNSAVRAADDLTMSITGLIDLQATTVGTTITARSADINIGTAGALGRSDQTNQIDISTDADILLGGAGGAASGFELDNDEFTRVHSGGDITISANGFSTGDGNLTVDDLSVAVASGIGGQVDGNIGQGGTLVLEANNSADIVGDLTVRGATADNVLAIDAIENISIDVDTGNLRVEDSNGAITGTIDFSGRSIIAASATALTDIDNASTTDADIRLGQNDGMTRDDGYIQGATVTFNIDDSLLIQNSGTGTELDDRRGVVADTVTINSASPDVTIVFNGIVGGATGLDAISVTGVPADFNQASTINGCLIIDPASCVPIITPEPNPVTTTPNDDLVQDLIEDQTEGSSPVDGADKIGTILVDIRENPESAMDPLIDEPVTGAGNEDLWVSDEEECDESSETCDFEPALEPAE